MLNTYNFLRLHKCSSRSDLVKSFQTFSRNGDKEKSDNLLKGTELVSVGGSLQIEASLTPETPPTPILYFLLSVCVGVTENGT